MPTGCAPGRTTRYDYEYKPCGTCNIFIASEPLAGTRMVAVSERKTKIDWALFIEKIASRYEGAQKIILVMDNLNTHNPGSLMKHLRRKK